MFRFYFIARRIKLMQEYKFIYKFLLAMISLHKRPEDNPMNRRAAAAADIIILDELLIGD